MFPEIDLDQQRANLRKFREKVISFDYEVRDKLSARSYEARIIGYTYTHGIYRVLTNTGAIKVAKIPKPVTGEEGEDFSAKKPQKTLLSVNNQMIPHPPNNQYNHLRPQRKYNELMKNGRKFLEGGSPNEPKDLLRRRAITTMP